VIGSALAVPPAVALAGGEVSPVGLSLPEGMRVNEWERLGDQLDQWRNANLWWLADWVSYGDKWFRRDYPALIEKLYSRQALHDLASVARSVEPSRRREDLSFSHHREVAALEPVEQAAWLADAFDENWSHKELRERIQAWKSRGLPRSTKALVFRLPADRGERFERAATQAGFESVDDWLLDLADRASENIVLEAA
jgi:hypothetical protein